MAAAIEPAAKTNSCPESLVVKENIANMNEAVSKITRAKKTNGMRLIEGERLQVAFQ